LRSTKKGVRHLFFLIALVGMAAVPARLSHAADLAHAADLSRIQEDHLAAITERIARLEARYGISFKYDRFPPKPDYLKFCEVSDRDYPLLAEYLSLFEEEITKYPPGFFKDQDIRGIGLVMRLFSAETPAQGMFHHQARVMFFEISRFRKNKAQQRHSIHHEIFHMMVQKKGKGFAALAQDAWETLNHPDFFYGKQTKPLSEPNPYNRYAPNQLGFVTYYAMESAVEDQAEIFACLMLDQHRRLIEQWIINDPFLAKKVEVIKDFAQYYHPDMDAGY